MFFPAFFITYFFLIQKGKNLYELLFCDSLSD